MIKLNLAVTINLQRPDKKGRCAIRIRSTVKRKVTYYATGFNVLKDQFADGEVIRHVNKVSINAAIRKQMAEIEQAYIDGTIGVRLPRDTDFYAFCEAKIAKQKSKDSVGTWKHKNSYLRKMKSFRANLRFDDITPSLMQDYENHCRALGNKPTTIWGCMKFVRTMINAAIVDNVITTNPMKGYKLPAYINPVRSFLTMEELNRLEDFAIKSSNQRLVNVANWFLFGCYTGLRYDDVRRFDKKDIVAGRLILRTGKSSTDVSIKLHPKLKKLIDNLPSTMMSNQKMNDYLKLVADACDIEKPVTFHTARHTFSVYFLTEGGSIELLQELLGHSDLKTTKIYGKIINKRIDSEMDKIWG